MQVYHCVHPFDISSLLKSTNTCKKQEQIKVLDSQEDSGFDSNSIKMQTAAAVTFPKSPLCLDRMFPPFFTATSRVLLWSSTIDTLNSNLQTPTFHTGFMTPNNYSYISCNIQHHLTYKL